MSKIFTTTLRLNLVNEDDRRALEYLRNMDRTRYRSYSSAIVTAINDHFSRQDAFLCEIKATIRESLQTSGAGLGGLAALLQSAQPASRPDETMSEDAFDTAMDFINGL